MRNSNPRRRPDIQTFEDFIQEAQMLPDDRQPNFNMTDPLERHFFEVADKHGVIDHILAEMEGEDYDS